METQNSNVKNELRKLTVKMRPLLEKHKFAAQIPYENVFVKAYNEYKGIKQTDVKSNLLLSEQQFEQLEIDLGIRERFSDKILEKTFKQVDTVKTVKAEKKSEKKAAIKNEVKKEVKKEVLTDLARSVSDFKPSDVIKSKVNSSIAISIYGDSNMQWTPICIEYLFSNQVFKLLSATEKLMLIEIIDMMNKTNKSSINYTYSSSNFDFTPKYWYKYRKNLEKYGFIQIEKVSLNCSIIHASDNYKSYKLSDDESAKLEKIAAMKEKELLTSCEYKNSFINKMKNPESEVVDKEQSVADAVEDCNLDSWSDFQDFENGSYESDVYSW